LALDSAGNLLILNGNAVNLLSPQGAITLLAGTDASASSVALDGRGNLYFVQPDGASWTGGVKKMNAGTGSIETVAGTKAFAESCGDSAHEVAVKVCASYVAVDSSGENLYISGAHRIRKIDLASGVITTVAGNGTSGFSGDGGPATSGQLSNPAGIALDLPGNLYIADQGNARIRRVDALTGIITTVAGNGKQGYSGDGGLAVNAQLLPINVRSDGNGNLYVSDSHAIRKVAVSTGIITTVAGNGKQGYNGDGIRATSASLECPADALPDAAGNLFIADSCGNRIRKVNASTGLISTVAGTGECCTAGDGGTAVRGRISPFSGAVDKSGNVYIADRGYNRIRKVDAVTGAITTIAGPLGPRPLHGAHVGFEGDGGPATSATLAAPSSVAIDSRGNVYFSDTANNRVRKIDSHTGVISTVAGSGNALNDGGQATSAMLAGPTGVAIDSADNLYIADTGNLRVRKVAATTGVITTFAGSGITNTACSSGSSLAACYGGDGGPATGAQLYLPLSLAVDALNNLYVVDGWKVRKVDARTGLISTAAGSDNFGYSGDSGPATAATLYKPNGVAVDHEGNIFVADWIAASVVRRVDAATGIISTIAGTGPGGSPTEGALAVTTQLGGPTGVSVDNRNGTVYVFDTRLARVFALSPVQTASPVVTAVANAASNVTGPVAPGEIVTIYGSGLGPASLVSGIVSNGILGTQLASTQVFFNGIPAPIIYTWSTAISAIVPYEVSGPSADVTIAYQGTTSSAVSVPVAPSAPGIFVWEGQDEALVLNQDGSINSPDTPAPVGSVVTLYATGEGQTSPAGVDGQVNTTPAPQPVLPVAVTIGGQTVKPQYAGGVPGEVAGVIKIDVQVPVGTQPGGAVPLIAQVGNTPSKPGSTFAVTGNQAAATAPFAEPFNASNSQWAVSSGDGVSMSYNSTTNPGIFTTTTSAGMAYAPWAVGSGDFNIRTRLNISNVQYRSNVSQVSSAFAISTGIPGSMSPSDSSIVFSLGYAGMNFMFLAGELKGANGAFGGQALYTSSSPGVFASAGFPQGTPSAPIPTNWNWWVNISRFGNRITWAVYTDHYLGGLSPYATNSWTMTSHTSDNYRYISVVNLTTNATGGFATSAVYSDIVGYGKVTGGLAHTITGAVPGGSDLTFQSGKQAVITGNNFDATSPYTVTVGSGSTYTTSIATYVNSTTLTVALPAEPNSPAPYQLHVTRNNIDAELMTGIVYSTPVLNRIDPHEVPPTPANSADATVQVYGQGFDSSCTMTFGGLNAAVSVVSPLQLSVIVPAGSPGSPAIVLMCNSSTVYDSNASGTFPPQGKVNFGYAPHPYLLFTNGPGTADSPNLAALQAKYADPSFASYRYPIDANIAPPPTPDTYCAPRTCFQTNQVQTWWDYMWHYFYAQDGPSLTAYTSGVARTLTNVQWATSDGQFQLGGGHFAQSTGTYDVSAFSACIGYDGLFNSLTPAQRTQYLNMIDGVSAFYNYIRGVGDANINVTSTSYSNRISMGNSYAGVCILDEAFSLNHIEGYTTATPYVPATYTTLLAPILTNLVSSNNSYGNNEWMPDGGCVEGSQYCLYGMAAYEIFGHALINTNAALGNGKGAQGVFTTNVQNARNYYQTIWDGYWWQTYNDTQPQNYGIPIMADFCDRYGQTDLCWMADALMNKVASDPGSYYAKQLNANVARGPDYGPFAFLWRSKTAGTIPTLPLISTLANVSYATIRSSTDWSPAMVVGLKGCSNHECGSNQHNQPDQGSIVLQSAGEEFLIDPGYFVSAAANHSRYSVAGSYGTGSGTASIDAAAQYSSGAWNCATVDASNTYSAVATVLRRNVCIYSKGNYITVVLDDIQPSGGATLVSSWQTGYVPSSVSGSGFTVTGVASALQATFFGPPSTTATPAVSWGCSTSTPSWVFCELQGIGLRYGKVTDTYNASAAQPRVTCLAPATLAGTAPLSCATSYGSGTLTVSLSDGSSITAVNGTGKWAWSSSVTAP
jgi:uncharacterized protein (TIGR03437 family)